jgi:formylglycine-generating enzyme required for sulfatase activity
MNNAPSAPWATAIGTDEFGPWADLSFGTVTQRFRWCPPGQFFMGSPDTEAGRFPDEGPRHKVTITQVYWMADSPVTQALYAAVMGNNPSHFADPAHPGRPVEQVSWHDAVAFCAALEARLRDAGAPDDGLVFRLPSEAEWEYTCRGGTQKATYNGDLMLRGRNDAQKLGAIAWTYMNSDGSTHPVATRAPNPWGLYDMLGNVWEWCADAVNSLEGYPGSPRVDPVGQAGPYRASRGGSWLGGAQAARAACRVALGPGDRGPVLGFRLSRGRAHAEDK